MTTNHETSPRAARAFGLDLYFVSGAACVVVCVVIVVVSIGLTLRSWPAPEDTRHARWEVEGIDRMAQQYMLQSSPSRAPDSLEDLTNGEPPVAKRISRDPWGNDYIYRRISHTRWLVFSAGPDGIPRSRDDIYPY